RDQTSPPGVPQVCVMASPRHTTTLSIVSARCVRGKIFFSQVDLGGYPLTVDHNGQKRVLRCFDDLLADIFSAKKPTLLSAAPSGGSGLALTQSAFCATHPCRVTNPTWATLTRLIDGYNFVIQ